MSRLLLFLFAGTIALCPVPLGSRRDWAWSPLALVVGSLVAVVAAASLFNVDIRRRLARLQELRVPALLFGIVVAWGFVQLSGWTPAEWRTSISAAPVLEPADARHAIAFDIETQLTAIMLLLTYAGAFVLAATLAQNAADARLILSAIVLAATFITIYSIVADVINSQAQAIGIFLWVPDSQSFSGSFLNYNHFATYAGIATLTALALGARSFGAAARAETIRERWRRRINALTGESGLWIGFAFILGMGVILSSSRAGTASLLISLMAMAVLFGRGYLRIAFGLSVPALAGLVLLFTPSGGRLGDKLMGMLSGEIGERDVIYGLTLSAIDLRPLVGWGMNSFDDLFSVFQPPAVWRFFDKVHNTYLELAFDLGVPAACVLLIAVLWIVLRCLRGWYIRIRDRTLPALGFLASVLVGFHCLFDFSMQIPAVACVYFAVLGVGWAQSRTSRA